MKNINITNGECLNEYLKNKYDGVFIPFNEAMIQGDLVFPVLDDDFINYRSSVHNVSKEVYVEKLNDFLQIKNYVNEINEIVLWFGKDAFCIINLIVVLVYLEQINYGGNIYVNLVDDYSFNILESNIKIECSFKELYLNLVNRTFIDTNINFINEGVKDYLYITSEDNFVLDYIKENINKLDTKELVLNILNDTYKYGLSDVFILSLIKTESIKKDN